MTPGTINANVLIQDQYRKERSSSFEAGITVDGDGLVLDYPGLFRRLE